MITPSLVKLNRLIITSKTSEWCKIPYPNHKKGCPNYDIKPTCPTLVKRVDKYFDLKKQIAFVYSEFNLENHMNKMREKHPNWSDKQLRCVLYWQSKSRKQLKSRVHYCMNFLNMNAVTFCPEGMGVNVYATAAIHGLKLERIRHLRINRHIALIGNKIR